MLWKSLFVLIFSACYVSSEEVPEVATTLGKINGIYEKSYNGKTFSSFYGIPFAKPPVGDLRFQEPEPVSPWSGIWIANSSEITCAQVNHVAVPEGGAYVGDEDCLYLNVFVPGKQPVQRKSLDVVVHIHGGALMFGSSNTYTGPHYLMDRDIILVTMNYRVGALGFLSTEDEVLPGNNGMKDQVLALKWIRDHISCFGGNPNSVTLTGLSAGGASVHMHYFSPLSRGLFHRGMSFSGNALTPWVLQDKPLLKAKIIGARLGCTHENTKDLINCLKHRSTRQIVESVRFMRPWLLNPFSPLGVVVEKAGRNKFLAEYPYVLLKKGKIYDVPWITSITSEEGLYPAADYVVKESYLPDLEKRWLELAPSVLDYNYTIPADIRDDISKKIKDEYLNGNPISRETYNKLINMMSDRLFSIPAEKAAKMQAHIAQSPIFFYYFTYPGDDMQSFAMHWAGRDQHDGVSHGEEMNYIFTNPHKPVPKLTPLDERMKEMFLNILTSYISNGRPSVELANWQPVSKDLNEPLMQLHIKGPADMVMQKANEIDRHRSMWENIPFAEDEQLFLYENAKDEL